MGTSIWDKCDPVVNTLHESQPNMCGPSLVLCRRLDTVLSVEQRAAVISTSKFEHEVLVDSHLPLVSHSQSGGLIVGKDHETTTQGETHA